MDDKLKFTQIAARKNVIEKDVINLVESHNESATEQLKEKLQEVEKNEKLKIAFVGQHNAGKSSIISALTGNRQIKISNNVETDIATDYEWNNVILTDTPGLYAGMKEEHDKISLQKIKESDLLIFCITSSLFDNLLIDNFMDLAYKQMYKSKIFLVVNKMSLESGDFDVLVKNYKKSLRKAIEERGGHLEDFRIAFIDANDYMKGIEQNKPRYVEFSHFNSFIDLLNQYISEKKLSSKLDTPCRLIMDCIDNEVLNTSTDIDKNKLTLIRQLESTINRHRRELKSFMFTQENELHTAILSKSNGVISKIGSEEISGTVFDSLNDEIRIMSEKTMDNIQNFIDDLQNEMFEDMGDIVDSDMANFTVKNMAVNNGLDVQITSDNDFASYVQKYKSVADSIKKGSKFVSNMAGSGATLTSGVSAVAGSTLHSVVLNVGHFFGASFKPWQAVGIASKIGKVSSVLGPALSAITVIIDIVSKAKEEKQIQEIKAAKIETFNQFSSIANELRDSIDTQYQLCSADLFDSKINELDNLKKSIVRDNTDNTGYVKELKVQRKNIEVLILDIAKS